MYWLASRSCFELESSFHVGINIIVLDFTRLAWPLLDAYHQTKRTQVEVDALCYDGICKSHEHSVILAPITSNSCVNFEKVTQR